MREEYFKSQREAQIKKELAQQEEARKKNEHDDLQQFNKKQSLLRQMKEAMQEQQNHKIEHRALDRVVKASEKKRAIELEGEPFFERLKQQADQEKRRVAVSKHQEDYLKNVVPHEAEKKQRFDSLHAMYVEQREKRITDEQMRRTEQRDLFKSSTMKALEEQKQSKMRESLQAKE